MGPAEFPRAREELQTHTEPLHEVRESDRQRETPPMRGPEGVAAPRGPDSRVGASIGRGPCGKRRRGDGSVLLHREDRVQALSAAE